MNGMTKVQRIVYGTLAAAVLIVSIMAFLQPKDTPGIWRGVFPITLGVLGGFSLCLLVTYTSKKK
jgi:hypothetical protein